jgi:hypothetical protein
MSLFQSDPWRNAAVMSALSLAFGIMSAPASAKPFKVANIHIEANASACDMGIQMAFDTDGITTGLVQDPAVRKVYEFESTGGMKSTGGQTEGFLEGIEPQITELLSALGCTPSDEEGEMSLTAFIASWPAGPYTFKGQGKGGTFKGEDELTYHVPAGTKILNPAKGAVVPDAALLIKWKPVTEPILTQLGPVTVVGYHVVVVEDGAEALPQLDIDLPSTETSVKIPAQYLKPNTVYQLEVLTTEESGNQTISEGFFCTTGVVNCALK